MQNNEIASSDSLVAEKQNTHDTNNTSLASDMLGGPGKVTTFQAESTVLYISTTSTDAVNALGPKLSACRLATELELPLFAVVRALSAGRGSLVPRGTSDT